jgi:phosphoglycolate phosphatase-like HAD superfamily hydrolase
MMRERLSPSYEPDEARLEKQESEWRTVTSQLEGLHAAPAELRVAISKEDGELKHTNFWDLDKTLLFAEPIHFAAVEQIYPEFAKDEESRKALHEFYVAGFTLGNSYREWDRMRRICEEGQFQYKDPAVYERDFMDDPETKKLIDEPGRPEQYHEMANAILQRYGKIAYSIMEQKYNADPEGFKKMFVKPEMIDLLRKKTRLGQVNTYMTANQQDFAAGLVKFSGIADYGLLLAPDEKMTGGGKEVAIEWLIGELAKMGLKVNRKRSTAIGDSIKGDVGSGAKTGLGSGVLVTETSEQIAAIRDRATKDTPDGRQIQAVLEGTDVEAIPNHEVPDDQGMWRFGRKGSQRP